MDIDPKTSSPNPPGGDTPSPPTPSPAEASLAERNRVLDEELRRQARLNETLQLQLLAIADGQRRPEPTPPDTPPSREDNPDAYNEWLVNKRVSEEVSKRLDPSVKAYTEDRKVVLSTAVEMAKFQVATKYPDLWKEVGEDVEKFISNFPPDVLARPGAIEEALWREVGIRATKKHLDDSSRSAAGGVGGGRLAAPPTEPAPQTPKLEGRAAAIAAREGIDPSTHADLKGAGRMSIDEYQKLKEARK